MVTAPKVLVIDCGRVTNPDCEAGMEAVGAAMGLAAALLVAERAAAERAKLGLEEEERLAAELAALVGRPAREGFDGMEAALARCAELGLGAAGDGRAKRPAPEARAARAGGPPVGPPGLIAELAQATKLRRVE